MKLRNGFVSNSSSSSFVLPKKGMTEKQITKLEGWFDGKYNGDDNRHYSTQNYFFGSISIHMVEELNDYLKGIEVDVEKIGLEIAEY